MWHTAMKWKDGSDRLPPGRVATILQFVKNTMKRNKAECDKTRSACVSNIFSVTRKAGHSKGSDSRGSSSPRQERFPGWLPSPTRADARWWVMLGLIGLLPQRGLKGGEHTWTGAHSKWFCSGTERKKLRSFLPPAPHPTLHPPRSRNHIPSGHPGFAMVLLSDPWRVLFPVIPFPQTDHGQCRSVPAPWEGFWNCNGAANTHQCPVEELPQSLTSKGERTCL